MKQTGKNTFAKSISKKKKQESFLRQLPDYSTLLIILLAILCFGKVVFFGFLDYDDNLFIVDNHKILADFSNLPNVFTHGIWNLIKFNAPYDYYRPLLIVSLMIDAKLGGTSTVIYHFSNLVYHILACLLLFRVLLKLDIKKETALVFTLLFTAHPVLTQAVAWIPGRNDILLTICILGSFLCFIDFIQSRKISFLVGHYLLFFLGLMTKETALALPVICFLYSSVLLKKKIFSKETLGYGAAWVALMVIYFFIRTKAIGPTETNITPAILVETIIYRLPAIVQYIGKAVFPFNLAVKPTQQDTGYLWGIAALVSIGASLYFSPKKNYRMIVFGATWFLLFLLPALLLPKSLNDNLFEHRLYASLVGVIILMSESILFKNDMVYSTKRIMMSIGVIALFAIIAFAHANTFRQGNFFWENAALNSPHDAEAQFFFGKQYFKLGDAVNTEIYLNKALALKADYKRANAGLAVMYAQKGEMEKAKKYYEAEIRLGTKDIEDFKGLGSVLISMKKPDEALACFQKALAIDSTDESSNGHLAVLYFDKQNYDAAQKVWERMIALNPSKPDINKNLAVLYFRRGVFDKALEYGIAEEKLGGKMPDGFMDDMKRKLEENR